MFLYVETPGVSDSANAASCCVGTCFCDYWINISDVTAIPFHHILQFYFITAYKGWLFNGVSSVWRLPPNYCYYYFIFAQNVTWHSTSKQRNTRWLQRPYNYHYFVKIIKIEWLIDCVRLILLLNYCKLGVFLICDVMSFSYIMFLRKQLQCCSI